MLSISSLKMRTLLQGLALLSLLAGNLCAEAAPLVLSAPLCRAALISPPTQKQIDATLDSVARMTLSVDLIKSSGNRNDIAQIMFVRKYQEKLAEVQLSLKLDLPSLRKLLSERIARLQQLDKIESENRALTDRSIRDELRIIRPEYIRKKTYKNLKSLPFPSAYLPETKSILTLTQERALLLLNLESRKSEVLAEKARGLSFSPDKKYTYVIGADGDLSTYLTGTKNLVSSVKLGLSGSAVIRSLDVSDNGSKAAVSITTEVRVFDLMTGEKIYSKNSKKGTILHTKFIGEDALFMAANTGEISRYDFNSQTELSRKVDDSIPIGLIASSATKNIIVAGVEGLVYFYDAQTLEPARQLHFYDARGLKEVSRQHGLYAMINISGKKDGGIYHYDEPSLPLFDFNNEYSTGSNKKVDEMAFSPDAKSIVVFYETEAKNSYTYSIDLWELK